MHRVKIPGVNTEGGVNGRRIVDGDPFIDAPVHNGSGECLDPEDSASRHGAHLVVKAPGDMEQASGMPPAAAVRMWRCVPFALPRQDDADASIANVKALR